MECLHKLENGRCPSYLTPLFWLHGEEEGVLRHMVAQMHENGIGEFVVESRPHPDFLGEQWWRDVDILLDEAKKRDMKLWFFDDRKFPSGFSAGMIRDHHPEYLKIYLAERHLDAVGPQADISVLVDAWLEEGERLVSLMAARRTDGLDGIDPESIVELTDAVRDGILLWDVPKGAWRIFFLIATREDGERETRDYLNPLDPEPVQAMLKYVYEPYYARYSEEFGKTIAGFFTDEARFGSAESYDQVLGQYHNFKGYGRPKMVIPWSHSLLRKLTDRWGGDFTGRLLSLWYDVDEKSQDARYVYMDVVSRLFADHYNQQIGDWCRAHNVKYMGHLIEENGAHARLGYGAGHFFRAIRGQDYPGLDLIHQVWPGVTEGRFTSQVGYLDADFFYWGITKMAASAAHIRSADSGITMCEIFGAYGWQAGLKLMKWLTDHICVRGVNQLVPHAFSPKACDWDAPPHFYDRGLNPQWRYFHIWADYANRICHLLRDGTHVASAAVLYHAEAEWAGKYMPFEQPVKALMQRQIDCDILPIDAFTDGEVSTEKGVFRMGGECYRAMIVPYGEKLPENMLEALLSMANAEIPVIFVEDYPVGSPEQTEKCQEILISLKEHKMVQVLALSELPEEILSRNLQDVSFSENAPDLRVYHYDRGEMQVYFLTNEGICGTLCGELTLPNTGIPVLYDAMDGTVSPAEFTREGEKLRVKIRLDAWQSQFLLVHPQGISVFDGIVPQAPVLHGYADEAVLLTLPKEGWKVSLSQAPAVTEFKAVALDSLCNTAAPGRYPETTGTFRYEKTFSLETLPGKNIVLDLGSVFETAEVMINGKSVGARIAPPYCFRVTDCLRQGENTICVDVTNTLAKERGKNLLDRDMVQEPSGLLGEVKFFEGV